MNKYFVWTRSTYNRPEPQIWSEAALDMTYASTRDKVICNRLIPVWEYDLSIDELATKYPLPKVKQ